MKFIDVADREEAKSRLEALLDQIPELLSLTVGLDVVGSPASFDLCLTTTHDSVETLKAYQDHPAHEALAIDWLRPKLADRVIVDYES